MPSARMQPDSTLHVPQFTLGDRLRRARRDAGMEAQDLAAELGVSRNTISNAENDRGPVARRTLVGWAWATGVPIDWLEHGTTPAPPTTGGQPVETPTPTQRRGTSTRRANSRCSSATAAELGVLPRAS